MHAVTDRAAVIAAKGLEGVVVGTTAISLVDGEAGRLYYRGHAIEELTAYPFAAVANLILSGELPAPSALEQVEDSLREAGELPASLVRLIAQAAATDAHPMAVLQSVMPLLALEPATTAPGRSNADRDGWMVAARLPATIATIHAVRQGRKAPAYPNVKRYGERALHLLHERSPSARDVEVFEQIQILQLDHSFNASTFTARVVTSTLAPAPSALAAAAGALFGPLHGGADQAALEMAEEIGQPALASAFVDRCLESKRRVMGMGHREYRVVDPRAKIIRALAEQAAHDDRHRRLFETLEAVERAFVEKNHGAKRPLRANLEFYKGVAYSALGIPKELFTPMFAAARVFGWLAHILEQLEDNKLIRPAAHYVGPQPTDGRASAAPAA